MLFAAAEALAGPSSSPKVSSVFAAVGAQRPLSHEARGRVRVSVDSAPPVVVAVVNVPLPLQGWWWCPAACVLRSWDARSSAFLLRSASRAFSKFVTVFVVVVVDVADDRGGGDGTGAELVENKILPGGEGERRGRCVGWWGTRRAEDKEGHPRHQGGGRLLVRVIRQAHLHSREPFGLASPQCMPLPGERIPCGSRSGF